MLYEENRYSDLSGCLPSLHRGGLPERLEQQALRPLCWVSLEAFFHCNGCEKAPETDKRMIEKLDQLQSLGVKAVHTGVCAVKAETKALCPTIVKIQDMLRSQYYYASLHC